MKSNSPVITYAVPIADQDHTRGETPVYRNPKSINSLNSGIERLPFVKTLQDLHEYNAKAYADLDCLGSREKLPEGRFGQYHFKSYKTCYDIARKAGSAILNLGLAPVIQEEGICDHRFISILAKNCEEWVYLNMASCLYGISVVPIYEDLTLNWLEFVFKQTEVTNVFVSEENLEKVLEYAGEGKLSKLETIVCLSDPSIHSRQAAEKANLRLLSWEEFMSFGEKVLPYPKVTPDTIFTLLYTSGTTGIPKAAVFTHSNLVTIIGSWEDHNAMSLDIANQEDVHLSYLPIAHGFERCFINMILCRGVTIGFYSGDPKRLKEDLQALKPTFMVGYPRLYNKFYEELQELLNNCSKDENKYNAKENVQLDEADYRFANQKHQTVFQTNLLNKMKSITGGRVKYYMSGGAPISTPVVEFLNIALDAPIRELFGQTEAGICFMQSIDDTSVSNIGGIFTHLEFKLVDIPEMNCTCKDKGPNGEPMPSGELCMRGGSIFQGYYKNPEKTAETIDQQGWFHTGDVAMILPNGAVKLIDRKNSIFKIANGDFLSPENIQSVYLTNKYVSEVFVYGDPLKHYPVAIIVPNNTNLMKLGQELGLEKKTFEELCQEQEVIRRVLEDVTRTGKSSKLLKFELARNIYLEPNSFVSLGLTTSLTKLKRKVAKDYFADILENLYEQVPNDK